MNFWACPHQCAIEDALNERTGPHELGRRTHDLRRTAARDRVDDGTRERVVMAMTNHTTRAMYDRYGSVPPWGSQ